MKRSKFFKNIGTIACLALALPFMSLAQTTTIQLPQATQCCTVVDTDGDGMPDAIDKCPTDAGVYALQGCPVPAATSGQAYSFDCDHAGTAIVDVTLSDGSVWMDRNMGALRRATDEIDLFAGGCTYQYGRKPDGHQFVHYFQPKNWLNGYPTAGNVLGDQGAYYSFGSPSYNGATMIPNFLKSTPGDGGTAIGHQSMLHAATSPVQTYKSSSTPGTLANDLTPIIPTATVDGAGARTNIGTYIYANYSWYSDIATYPLATTLPTLWGGEIGYYNVSATATAYPLEQDWGTELNPVCPTGYHVPTVIEWYNALRSIAVTDAYTNGNWGTSKLHLTIAFGDTQSPSYWTSTMSQSHQTSDAAYYTVSFTTDFNQNTLDPAAAGPIYVNNNTLADGYYIRAGVAYQNTHSLYVRCKKN